MEKLLLYSLQIEFIKRKLKKGKTFVFEKPVLLLPVMQTAPTFIYIVHIYVCYMFL